MINRILHWHLWDLPKAYFISLIWNDQPCKILYKIYPLPKQCGCQWPPFVIILVAIFDLESLGYHTWIYHLQWQSMTMQCRYNSAAWNHFNDIPCVITNKPLVINWAAVWPCKQLGIIPEMITGVTAYNQALWINVVEHLAKEFLDKKKHWRDSTDQWSRPTHDMNINYTMSDNEVSFQSQTMTTVLSFLR